MYGVCEARDIILTLQKLCIADQATQVAHD
jgi:hypothetical protein